MKTSRPPPQDSGSEWSRFLLFRRVGIELGRADFQVEAYQPCPFGCKVGSQFHHSHVSRGPPIIPDGRISQVRFETLAFLPWRVPSVSRGSSADSHTPRNRGLPIAWVHQS